MITKDQNPYFKTYHCDNALLIQFILVEFLTIHHLSIQIRSLSDQYIESEEHSKTFLYSLSLYLTQLIGFHTQDNIYPFKITKGSLTKLKEYCNKISKNNKHQSKSLLTLYQYAYQAWLSALKNKDIIDNLHHHNHSTIPSNSILKIRKTIGHFYNQLNRITKHLPRVVHIFWENENVMFFLIRKKENFTTIYGGDFVQKFFKTYANKKEVVESLTSKYVQRGYNQLFVSKN